MKLTDRIKDRLLKYKESSDKSLREIHMDVIRSGHDITYEGLRHFITTDSCGSGHTLNILDEFLTDKSF